MKPRGGWIHDEVGPVKNWARTTAWPTFCPKPGRERERKRREEAFTARPNKFLSYLYRSATHKCVCAYRDVDSK